jgi:hypothetical protein
MKSTQYRAQDLRRYKMEWGEVKLKVNRRVAQVQGMARKEGSC